MPQSERNPTSVAGNLMDEFGGSVVNVLLGGLLLWVGQTTFEHNGELAGIRQQLEGLNDRHQLQNSRYDRVLESINVRTKGRFTVSDGEKLSQRIDSLQLSAQSGRRQLQDRLAKLHVQASVMEVQMQTSSHPATRPAVNQQLQDITRIRDELNSIRSDMNRLTRTVGAVYQNEPRYNLPPAVTTRSADTVKYQSHSGTIR